MPSPRDCCGSTWTSVETSVSIESNVVTTSIVTVADMSGKIIFWQNVPIYNGMNKIELPIGKYAESGVYMVRMTMNDKVYTKKLIVSK